MYSEVGNNSKKKWHIRKRCAKAFSYGQVKHITMKEEITTQTGKSTNFFFGSVASDKNLHFEENDTD